MCTTFARFVFPVPVKLLIDISRPSWASDQKLDREQTSLRKQEVVTAEPQPQRASAGLCIIANKKDNIALCRSVWSDLWPAAAAVLGSRPLVNPGAAAFGTFQLWMLARENLLFSSRMDKVTKAPLVVVSQHSLADAINLRTKTLIHWNVKWAKFF